MSWRRAWWWDGFRRTDLRRRALVLALVGLLVALVGSSCSSEGEVTASRRSAPRPAADVVVPDSPRPGSTFDDRTSDDPALEGGGPCPEGALTVSVTDVDVTDEFGTGTWMVELTGTLTNDTGAAVTAVFLDVVVPGAMDALAFTDDFEIPAGATTGWTATTLVMEGPAPSAEAIETVIDSWMWADFDLMECPTS